MKKTIAELEKILNTKDGKNITMEPDGTIRPLTKEERVMRDHWLECPDWIGEITCIATKTVIVKGRTKKEALENLKKNCRVGVEGIDVSYGPERSVRIIRKDGNGS